MVGSLHITHLKRKPVNGLFAAVPGLGKVNPGMFWKTKRKTENTVSKEAFGDLEYNLVRSARRTLAMHVKSDATLGNFGLLTKPDKNWIWSIVPLGEASSTYRSDHRVGVWGHHKS